MMEESVDYLKFTVYHEYGRLYYNDLKFLNLCRISENLIILAGICFLIYSNLISSKPKDKTRLALESLSCSQMTAVMLEFSGNFIRHFIRFVADDFAVSLQGDLSGIDAYFLHEKDNLENYSDCTLFYPPFLHYFTQPSVYHRYLRQVSRIK